MKFYHNFELVNSSPSLREYESGDALARIDFISGSALRVALYRRGEKLSNTFNVSPDNDLSHGGRERLSTKGFSLCDVSEKDGLICMPCGVDIGVDLNNFLLSYYKGSEVLFRDRAPLAYNIENEFGATCHYISREENEYIYGCGDKGGSLNKYGRAFRIETTDCMGYNAASTDPLYKHIPFYICENSVGCYGIFYDTSCTSYLDFGKEIDNYYELVALDPSYKGYKPRNL